MKILDVIEGRKGEGSLEHDINPVYDTARNCLVNLAKAECQEALLLNKYLRFTENTEVDNPIAKGTALFQEIRYRFVNRAIEETGYKNIMDVGCGFSPRAIPFSKKGYDYVGADLPAAIKELYPAISLCMNDDQKSHAKFIGLDATNPGALVDAAKEMDGPICIVTEGLLMYLPIYELNEYIEGLKRLLTAHGGCVITPDFCMNRLLKISAAATSLKKVGDLLQKGATMVVKEYTIHSDHEMDPSIWYAEESDEKPFQFFTGQGFKIERIPVYGQGIELNTLKYIKASKVDGLLEKYKETYGWKITL